MNARGRIKIWLAKSVDNARLPPCAPFEGTSKRKLREENALFAPTSADRTVNLVPAFTSGGLVVYPRTPKLLAKSTAQTSRRQPPLSLIANNSGHCC